MANGSSFGARPGGGARWIVLWAALLAAAVGCQTAPSSDPQALDRQAMQQAATLMQQGKSEEALSTLEQRIAENPGSLPVGNFYRATAVSVKQYDRPIKYLNAQIDRLPAPPNELRFNLAFAYIDKIPAVGPMGAGFLSKNAIKQFQTVLDREPDNWIANYGIGMNYLHWPEYFEKQDESMRYFDKCLEIQARSTQRPPYFVLTAIRLGDGYAKAGQVEKARAAWQAGLKEFPGFSDLTSRLALSDADTVAVIKEMYNPNNSIGEIDTDVSILWVTELPASTLPLKRTLIATGGRGVGGQFVADKADDSDARFFVWFKTNLPVLMRRADAGKIDMKGLGASGETDARGVGLIANDMVRGFMTQFQDIGPARTEQLLREADPFDRPFLHEGVGMGLGAALDTEGDGSLDTFAARIAPFDASYRRLHYAGLGMWYGLAPTINLVRIRKQFAALPLQAQIYAYEGLGFSVALFHQGGGKGRLEVADRLPFAAASAFAHGAGRAMWIRSGGDLTALDEGLKALPERFRADAISGFGMGVSFTRIAHPNEFFAVGDELAKGNPQACPSYLTGMAMGLAIRATVDPAYVEKSLAGGAPGNAAAARQLRDLGLTELKTLNAAQIEELHGNWRKAMRDSIQSKLPPPARIPPCKVSS